MSDIELEYLALKDPLLLNKQFQSYKNEHEKETYFDEPEIDEVDEIDEINEVNEINYYEEILRVLFTFILKLKVHFKLVLIILVLIILNFFLVSSINSNEISVSSLNDISKSLNNLQFQINELNQKNKVRLNEFKNYFDLNMKNIPIKLNNNQIEVIPELNSFLNGYIDNYLEVNQNSYTKNEILNLISSKFKENKDLLLNEIKSIAIEGSDEINYSLSSNGARIINYLTSPTFKPKFKKNYNYLNWFNSNDIELENSPFIILTSNDGYWKSSEIKNTTLAIRFLEPIYITNLKYYHKKILNSSILTSAPKKFSIFIETFNNDKFKKLSKFDEILNNNYFKISEFNYDLNVDDEQGFLPLSFNKVLIKSLIIRIDENYGNNFFTSLNKFKINGFTKFDVHSMKDLLNNDDINDDIKYKFKEFAPVKTLGEE